jgi:hypothetical protein
MVARFPFSAVSAGTYFVRGWLFRLTDGALSVKSVAIRTDCEAGFVKGDPALGNH